MNICASFKVVADKVETEVVVVVVVIKVLCGQRNQLLLHQQQMETTLQPAVQELDL